MSEPGRVLSSAPETMPRAGCVAPDFPIPSRDAAGAANSLRDLRGAPVVVAFHSPCWDPARADEIAAYAGSTDAITVLVRSDDAAAAAYGVTGHSAVFVLDEAGAIVWRHVAGIDASSAPERPSAEVDATGSSGRPRRQNLEPSTPSRAWSRRAFMAAMLGAAIALVLEPVASHAPAFAEDEPRAPGRVGDPQRVALTVNEKTLNLDIEPRVTLLDALREYAGLTGTKKGCDHGQCGACTVHIDGRRTLSCLTFAVMQQGKSITTIEGLAHGDALHPMQQAFIDHDGFQCGYCTSGQIMSATAVLHEPWGSGDDDVREAMSGNLCRCGAYAGIVAAVQDVRRGSGGQSK
ncbi:MAG TPA: 2Fe-2S iron-sulfur cluster-binding protein [Gemmatimonadaceae bacterium]|nr:2Fe-2S iron-sulfur cluster-binding protein [Gemmatimonadaceae bacterium]